VGDRSELRRQCRQRGEDDDQLSNSPKASSGWQSCPAVQCREPTSVGDRPERRRQCRQRGEDDRQLA
ncbi:hypothetical protein, partial [Rheinheimera sp.]|uniref:hypothetical protein n=1 Tax=Rheinheimera sp. TaxID=1869214 RepID=UPI00307EF449